MNITNINEVVHPISKALSPEAGLLCFIVLTSGILLNHTLIGVSLLFSIALLLSMWFKNFKDLFSTVVSTNSFMVFVWATLPFADPTLSSSTFNQNILISKEGILLAALITLKANTATLFLSIFITSNPHNTGRILQKIGTSPKLISTFILMYQHILFFRKDFTAAIQSLSLRTRKKTSPMQILKLYACLTGTLIVHSIDRGTHIKMFLSQRGQPLIYTYTPPSIYTKTDLIAFISSIGITLLTVVYFS